jgi:DNA helicase II / ATP-dependent DNA helicase PcrA
MTLMFNPEILTQGLNPAQSDAVQTLDGPLLILAGAGSGKTRVLTHRMASLIAQGLAAPDDILCVTFTNKAASEMQHRIYKILLDLNIPVIGELWISTFHSFCVRVLRRHIDLLDYKKPFTIYDSGDQLSQIKRVVNKIGLNDKMYPPKSFQSRISKAKMLGLTPEAFAAGKKGFLDDKTLQVYSQYELEMKKANALDFDDLLMKTHELFQMYPDILIQYQQKFRYIMVDEYQDTNHIQYLLMQLLSKAHRNFCVVGDEDQSIYSWRGADISNILNFEKDFPEAKIIKLEENYRSTKNIVSAATTVIANNSERKDKTLFTNNTEGEKIAIREENNEYDEARFVTQTIQKMLTMGTQFSDYAIFYRTNAQSRVLEEQLRGLAIPYRLVGGIRFYERSEIKDILCYFRLILNTNDDVAFKRIINVPTRGIGKTTVDHLDELAQQKQMSLYNAAQAAVIDRAFNAGTTSKLRRFLDLIDDLIGQVQKYSISEFYSILLDRTEYVTNLKKEDTPEAEARINNLEELDNALVQFEKERGEEANLSNYIEELTLASHQDGMENNFNAVTLMTLHISKGLEYPYVFIVGCEENLFPSTRGDEESESEIEEERRLAYVGMTRAREKLWMTYAITRKVWGQDFSHPVSRFINEIPDELKELTSGATRLRFDRSSSFIKRNAESDYSSDAFPDYENEVSGFESTTKKSYGSGTMPSLGGDSKYIKGARVRHPTFGVGSVYSTEGSGDALKISVLFQDNTIKKFVAKYARLEKV